MGPIGCPETSVNYYEPSLPNFPEVRISYLHHGTWADAMDWTRKLQEETYTFGVVTLESGHLTH
jgi:hypothetical protein